MTIREALNQPITVQALLTLMIGLGLGIAFSIASIAVFGSLMGAGRETACTPANAAEQRP